MGYFHCVLWIDPAYAATLEALGLNSLAALRNRFDPRTANPRSVDLVPGRLERPGATPLEVFYKQYNFRRPSWRFLGRPSKARCEFRNAENLRRLNIPVAERIACGEWRERWGRLRGAFIMTRTVPHALTLVDFWRRHCPEPTNKEVRQLRAGLRQQLARHVRLMHDGHFYHRDLYWRNLLVNWDPPAEPRLWWIDCPRGHFDRLPFFQRQHVIKDLACLDRWAHQLCTPEERLQFIREYLPPHTPEAEIKSLAHRIVTYRLQRWTEQG